MKSESDRPITIEDLLRLKRAERPPPEFWTTFDRELRAKQLSALVAKRPWWQTLPNAFPRLFRYRIALGTSAVAVLLIVSLQTDDRSQLPAVADSPVAVEPPSLADIPRPTAVMAAIAPSADESASIAVTEPVADVVAAATTTDVAVVARAAASPLDSGEVETRAAKPSPSAMVIAANLAGIRATDTEVSRSLLVKNNEFAARPAAARAAVEPLQQMTPPSDSRRSRLLTAMVSSASSETSYRTTERAASRIDDERLYDQIHRFGARGDRLNYKF